MKLSIIAVMCIIYSSSAVTTDSSKDGPVTQSAVVEMLIICDLNFVAQAGSDGQKFHEFWLTQIWDVNARFKTLVKTNVEVRVVDLIVLQKKAEPFTTENVTNDLTQSSKWLYRNMKRLKSFDIAIFAVGLKANSGTGFWANSGKICEIDHTLKSHLSFAVIKFHKENPYFSLMLAQSIAELLVPASGENVTNSCSKGVLNLLGGEPFTSGRFFYSKCADESISMKLRNKQHHCVFHHNAEPIDYLTNIRHTAPSSLLDQCKVIAKNSDAFIGEGPQQCTVTQCYLFIFSFGVSSYGTKSAGHVLPLENTPCGKNSNCFRGLCLKRGYQLQNVNSGQCIRSKNWFVSDDFAAATLCLAVPTPLEILRIEEGSKGKRLLSLYSKPYTTESLNKCLAINAASKLLYFKKCTKDTDEYWRLIGNGSRRKTFLMFHINTKFYLQMKDNSELVGNPNCNSSDSKFLWQFYDTTLSNGVISDIIEKKSDNEQKFSLLRWLREIFG